MTIIQLEYIEAISRYRSFSKASKELNISQPALTLQVKKLEDEIGFTIFNRTQKPLSVTREGEIFISKALQAIKMVNDLYDVAIDLEEEIKGTLNIGIIPTIAPYITPIFINDLSNKYPKLKIHIKEQITEEVILSIKNGETDAGIIATPVQAKGVIFEKLFYEKFYLYVSNNSKFFNKTSVKVNEIDLEELWYLNEGNCFQNQVNALCKISKKLIDKQNFRYQSNSIESLKYIVENRGGMTFIPELATLTVSSEKEDMIKDINGLQPIREISLVKTKFAAKQKLIDAFLEVLMKNIPKRMKNIQSKMILDTQIITN